jgi:hypothetical protein
VGKKNMLVSIDETTDASGRKDTSIVIGVFRNGKQRSDFLCHARKFLQ